MGLQVDKTCKPMNFCLFCSYQHLTSVVDIDAASRWLSIELSAIEGVPYFCLM